MRGHSLKEELVHWGGTGQLTNAGSLCRLLNFKGEIQDFRKMADKQIVTVATFDMAAYELDFRENKMESGKIKKQQYMSFAQHGDMSEVVHTCKPSRSMCVSHLPGLSSELRDDVIFLTNGPWKQNLSLLPSSPSC